MRRGLHPVVLACAVGAAGVACAPPHGDRGPWLQALTDDAVTVVFETARDTSCTVRWGRAGSALSERHDTPARTHHEVRLEGLAALAGAARAIDYAVRCGDRARAGSFLVAPRGDTPFSFLIYGDNRSDRDAHAAVIDALLAEPAPIDFAVHSGDFVDDGMNEAQWDEFFNIEHDLLVRTPLFVAIGNHEVVDGRWDIARRLFVPPPAMSEPSDSDAYYRVRIGNTELIVLNIEVDSLSTFEDGPQQRWLTRVLAERAAGVRHRFVILHQGPYSSKVGREGNFWLRQWLDELEAAGVEAIFSGHDHYAERGFTRTGMPYFVHGGGGAPLYETLGVRAVPDHTITFGETHLGYIVVDVDGERVDVTLKGLGGDVLSAHGWGNATAPACTFARECAVPTPACDNARAVCVDRACRVTCDTPPELIACTDDGACAQLPCDGRARCDDLGVCRCDVTAQCERAADCEELPPPIPGCVGTWACMDDVCEFTARADCGR